MDLFMDEAGYTGPDLVNRDQPVFVLASTVLTEAEARDLLTTCFPPGGGARAEAFQTLSNQ